MESWHKSALFSKGETMSCRAKDCYMYKTCLAKSDLAKSEPHCADYRKALSTTNRKEIKNEREIRNSSRKR